MLKYKKNKEFKIIIYAFVLLFGAWSCEDLVDEEPISEIGPDSFYETNEDLLAGLISVYDGMQSFYRDQFFLWGEFRADNHKPTGSGGANNEEIANNVIGDNNGATRWTDLYKTVSRANDVIINIPNVAGYNENYLAEALAIRAKCYFDAVRVWGDVPLFVTPVKLLSEATKPATDANTIINEVIIPDMIRAAELSTFPSDEFRFSKSSIYALQAEVYMYLKDYPKAKTAIQNLFALGEHRLVTTPAAWKDLFYNSDLPEPRGKIQTGSELIFSIAYDNVGEPSGSGNSNRSGIAQLFRGGIPQFLMSEQIENKWTERFPTDSTEWVTKYPTTNPATTRMIFVDDGMGGVVEEERFNYGDWRFWYSRQNGYSGLGSIQSGEAKTGKWGDTVYPSGEDQTDVVVYRYADFLLLLAEIENELNPADGTEALTILNTLRAARQLPAITALEFGATKGERLDFILDERQFELFGEAKRYWDLVRNNKAISTMQPILAERGIDNAFDRGEGSLLWPIHIDHLLENPLLEQNEAYK